jgi:hypothetical protein
MQLDSHHRFIDGWDTTLIDMLESVRDVSPKPLLTAYVPSFDPENDPDGRVQEPWKQDFDRFIPEGTHFTRPSTIDDWRERDKPMRARFYSAHFAFADGTFAEEVQHDPEFFFHGEEVSIGVRAFTNGYDMYHPHRVVVWHEYTRKGRIKVWDDHTTQQKTKGKIKEDWWEKNVKSHKRNRILFGMDGEDQSQIDFGKYGFGTVRSVRDYEEFSGVAFKYRGVQQCVLDRTEPLLSGWKHYETEEEWRNTIAKSNDIRICFQKSELNLQTVLDDINNPAFVSFIGYMKPDGSTVLQKDIDPANLSNQTKEAKPVIEFSVSFEGDELAVIKEAETIAYLGYRSPEGNLVYHKILNSKGDDASVAMIHRVEFSNDELAVNNDQYDFWYVVCHDEYGKEIYRKDQQEHEIRQLMADKNPWIDYRFIFMCDPTLTAKTYTIWAHSKTKGWLTKLDKMADS